MFILQEESEIKKILLIYHLFIEYITVIMHDFQTLPNDLCKFRLDAFLVIVDYEGCFGCLLWSTAHECHCDGSHCQKSLFHKKYKIYNVFCKIIYYYL